jgi:hypothetical protein
VCGVRQLLKLLQQVPVVFQDLHDKGRYLQQIIKMGFCADAIPGSAESAQACICRQLMNT